MQKFSNKILIQWGSIISDATWQKIILPTSYTSTLYKVVVGVLGNNAPYGSTAIPPVQKSTDCPISKSSFYLGLYAGSSLYSMIYQTIGY